MRRLALAAAAALTLAACGGPSSGIIIGKSHRAAYSTLQCSTVGKVTTCYPITYPETWSLKLRLGSDEGWHGVDEATWQQYRVGDVYEGDPS